MDYKNLKLLLKENNWLKNHISIGFSYGKICITHNLITKKYQVFIPERQHRYKFKEFLNKDEASKYLWTIFGGTVRFNRLKNDRSDIQSIK